MIDNLFGLVNKFVPDADKAKELEAQIKTAQEEALKQAVAADKEVRLAELRKGGIAAAWRPLAALSLFTTITFHWLIIPLARVIITVGNFNAYMPQLEPLPMEFYGLAGAFVSIYAYGRSMEKRGL
jgi:hypothetical protein